MPFTELGTVPAVRPAEVSTEFSDILTPEALRFLEQLNERFENRRRELIEARHRRQAEIDAGAMPGFLPETEPIRRAIWRVADVPEDLKLRQVEITGPVEAKMMINALNSGADVFMADFEDSLSPTWMNVLRGQRNLMAAVRRDLRFESAEGKRYALNQKTATLLVRPRGWHLIEAHASMSASLFDFGLYFFHNARELLDRGSAPYFYLPKMESHHEARLWNDAFCFAQDYLHIPRGTVRATVLIETILAAFEMEEILFELRNHVSGLNAGRWDYIFSAIKKFRMHPVVFPDRAQITMETPFMEAYCRLLVRTCKARGAQAIGGMAAFIPSRKDADVNARALAEVAADKEREARQGFDGTWIAHPDLVAVARAPFAHRARSRTHAVPQTTEETPRVVAAELLDLRVAGGKITEAGMRQNVSVAIQYLAHWLAGTGAVAIQNLMEDVATAEISRAELWQWIQRKAHLNDGRAVTPELFKRILNEEKARLASNPPPKLEAACRLLERLVLREEIPEFLTLEAYGELEAEVEVQKRVA